MILLRYLCIKRNVPSLIDLYHISVSEKVILHWKRSLRDIKSKVFILFSIIKFNIHNTYLPLLLYFYTKFCPKSLLIWFCIQPTAFPTKWGCAHGEVILKEKSPNNKFLYFPGCVCIRGKFLSLNKGCEEKKKIGCEAWSSGRWGTETRMESWLCKCLDVYFLPDGVTRCQKFSSRRW